MTIGILRALNLGDLLCSIPAFRALRQLYPQAYIVLFGLPWQKELIKRYPSYLNEFMWFPGYPSLPEQPVNPPKTIEFIHQLQHRHLDLLIQMQGEGVTLNPFLILAEPQHMGGFYTREFQGLELDYFIPYPKHGHEIHRLMAIVTHLGSTHTDSRLEFPLTPKDEFEYDQLNLNLQPRSYICLHVGARNPQRRWSLNNFLLLAQELSNQGHQLVFTGSTSELDLVNHIQSFIPHSINLAGKTSLGSLAVILSQASLLICNDTGVSHLAVALKVPSIVISLSDDPGRWSPLDSQLHPTVIGSQADAYCSILTLISKLTH